MLRSSLTLLFLLGFFGCGDSEKIIPVSDNNATSDNRVSPNPEDNDLQSEQTSAPDSLETHNVKFAGIEMIWVEPGEFQMGSSLDSPVRIMDEKPRQIKITRGFYLGKYEITQRQYSVVMEDNVADLNPRPSRFPGPRHPVEQVSWKMLRSSVHALPTWSEEIEGCTKDGLIVYQVKPSGSTLVVREAILCIPGVMKFF